MTASRISAAALGCVTLLFVASQAQATDLPVWDYRNPNGGRPYRIECGAGSYLTGFSGRAGTWVDTMAIACSPWLNKERALGDAFLVEDAWVGSSGGGDSTETHCPVGWVIAGSHRLIFSEWENSGLFHSIEFDCRPPDLQSDQRVGRTFGSSSPSAVRRRENDMATGRYGVCPPGEFATGIQGRSGLFVDALGLICRSAPEVVLCAAGLLICGVPMKPKKPEPMVRTKLPSELTGAAP